jgi:hypothetical protein
MRPKAINPRGDSVHTMCDRRRQVLQFIKFFRPNLTKHSKLPHVYLLHGELGQSHHSFVQRLKIDQIEPYAVSEKGELEGAVHHITTPWMMPLDDLEAAKNDLLISLFEKVAKSGYDPARMSAPHFFNHRKLTPYPFVVVEHDFHVAEWDATLSALIEWYLTTYWAEAGTRQNQILLFLNFIYPSSVRPLWRRFSRSNLAAKSAFNEFLRNLSVAVHKLYPCLLFDELGNLDRIEVCRTLGELGIHDDEECPDWLETLFRKKRGKVSMVDVEKLIKTHLRFPNEQQGLNTS